MGKNSLSGVLVEKTGHFQKPAGGLSRAPLTPWPPLSRKKTRERGGKQAGSRKRKRKDGLNRGWAGRKGSIFKINDWRRCIEKGEKTDEP